MIRGAIFDVDGVLLDSMKIWEDLGARYLRERGLQPEPGLNEILFSMSMEQGAAYLKNNYGLFESEPEILQGFEDMLKHFYYDEVEIKPGTKDMLVFLADHQIPLVLATSSPREHITHALERNGILHYFGDNLFTTGELGISKHQPDIYYQASAAIGTEASETLVFEDSFYALETAKKAGFIPVGVYDAYGASDPEDMRQTAKVYLKDFSQFQDSWEELNY